MLKEGLKNIHRSGNAGKPSETVNVLELRLVRSLGYSPFHCIFPTFGNTLNSDKIWKWRYALLKRNKFLLKREQAWNIEIRGSNDKFDSPSPFARNVLAVRHDLISRFFFFYLRLTIPVSESKDLRQVSRASHRLLRGFVYSVSKRLGALRVKCKTQFARLA